MEAILDFVTPGGLRVRSAWREASSLAFTAMVMSHYCVGKFLRTILVESVDDVESAVLRFTGSSEMVKRQSTDQVTSTWRKSCCKFYEAGSTQSGDWSRDLESSRGLLTVKSWFQQVSV